MKHSKKIISALCVLTILVSTLGGCVGDMGVTDESSDNTDADVATEQQSAEQPTEQETEPDIEVTKVKYDLSTNILSEMPRIDVNTPKKSYMNFATDPNRVNKWDYTDCTITVSNCDEKYELTKVDAGIKVRGNYTADYPKKPFRIKFDEKQNMLGLNDGANCKNWVLLADYKDSSMLRNIMALYLGRTLLGSDGYYTSDFCNVELYINGQYWGVYLLVEQQQVNPNRVDVYEATEDYKGTDIGYLVEMDAYYNEEPPLQRFELKKYPTLKNKDGYDITCGQRGYSIKNDIYSEKQRVFISNYVQNVFNICYEAIYNKKYYTFNANYSGLQPLKATSAEEAIERVINIDSLVDMYILQEIACDCDIAWSSFFMSVDMSETGDKKLTFEAPWDFDSAFGIRDVCKSGSGYYAANKDNPWLLLFVRQEWFMAKVRAKWQEARDAGVFKGALTLINSYKKQYSSYYAKNYKRWNNLSENVGGELVGEVTSFRTHLDAANYFYNWLNRRFTYLEKEWGKG